MKNRIDLCSEWRAKKLDNGMKYVFPAPDGAGLRPNGFDFINEAAVDVMRWYGFRLCLLTKEPDAQVLVTAGFAGGRTVSSSLILAQAGEHRIDLALEDFDIERAKSNIWRELVFLQISGEGGLQVSAAELLRGSSIAIETGVLGKPGKQGENVSYSVTVHNCHNHRQWVCASQVVQGWESLYAKITPERFLLEPYASCSVQITVQVHDYMPAGAHEKTTVRFLPEGDSKGAQEVSFTTLSYLEHPYIYHTRQKWAEVAEKIRTKEIFRPGFEKYKADADRWQVPELVPFGERDYCCDTSEEHYIMSCAYCYSITKEKGYAEKIAAFFRNFADLEKGYPARKKGCSQSYVQEGHFFQHLALAYDMIYDAGVLCEEERNRIEECFRIYMQILDTHICSGHISNWVLSELTGAVYCAMVLQDFERMERFLFGNGGTFAHLCYGTFADGWWHECSVGYNIWVSSLFLHTAHALLPFGINLIHFHFPLSYGKEVDSINKGETRKIRHGMYNEKWGGIAKSYICIKDLFDAVIPFLDERGVLFGINDSDEKKIEGVHFGSTFDLAYTHYQDAAYIPIIRRFDVVDPVFGHAELPNCEEGKAGSNAYSDNIGIAMLRSQTEGREQKKQIQAVLRYGSHGYAHGHFDRTQLLSVMRYGRSFYNPEHLWWGYPHFMYKFYVQNSNTKNMVVVDGKMQIPADAKKILFYSGKGLQAAGVRTVSRWGFPPFGGMIYDGVQESLKDRCELNASDLPSYDAAPYGEITEITEPVEQTRVMAVLDDCIVIFDSLRGQQAHRYESLLQIKGFESLAAVNPEGEVRFDCHTGKKSDDARSDEQFITDCSWYEAKGETAAKFVTKFGEGKDLRGMLGRYNEPGNLCMDVYTAWPQKTRQCIGLAAEDMGQKFPYELKVWEDENCISDASANAWLLGARKLDVRLNPESRKLKLEIFAKPLYTEQRYPYDSKQCLFFGNAHIVLEDGEKLSLAELAARKENIDSGFGIGKDYEGGRVLIEGEEYEDAIPVSPADHKRPGVFEFDLGEKRAVRLCGVLGADNFPGEEGQRRRTYGVAQEAVCARFITVIEPHEGKAEVSAVRGISENQVEILYQNGTKQRVSVEGLDGEPSVKLETFRQGMPVQEEKTNSQEG